MRRLADRLGIRAPSLYKHFSHKRAQGRDLIDGFVEAAATFNAAALEVSVAAESERVSTNFGIRQRGPELDRACGTR
jgi:AcrR family transcriptional regulator